MIMITNKFMASNIMLYYSPVFSEKVNYGTQTSFVGFYREKQMPIGNGYGSGNEH